MQSVNWAAVIAIVGVLNLGGAVGMSALLWRMRGEFATRPDVKALSERLDSHHERISDIESHLKILPTGEAIHSLAVSIERLRGDINVVGERLSGFKDDIDRVEGTLTRHEDILSEAARRNLT